MAGIERDPAAGGDVRPLPLPSQPFVPVGDGFDGIRELLLGGVPQNAEDTEDGGAAAQARGHGENEE